MSTTGRQIAAVAVLALGCSATPLAVPPSGPHIDEEPVVVPYPPPPARVEIIPAPPARLTDPVWIDGEWEWHARRWVWNGGHWEAARPNAYRAPPTTVALSDGTLAYFPGAWHAAAAK